MDSGLTSIIYYHCAHCVVPLLLLIELDKLEDNVFIINRETMSKTIMPKLFYMPCTNVTSTASNTRFIVSFYVYL